MRKITLSLTAILALFLFSCQKESAIEKKPDTQLNGQWKLSYFTMDGTNSTEGFDETMGAFKVEIVMNYLSTNNHGTLSFDGKKITSNQMSYDVTGLVTMKTTIDGELSENADSLNIPMPPSNSSTNYIQVTADSIYCPNGSFIQMEGAEDMQSKPAGIKLKYEGDKLIMTATQKETVTVTENGILQDKKSDLKMIIILDKN